MTYVPPIPDPDQPTKQAIDSETGELLSPVYVLPIVENMATPTAAELEGATFIGWSGGIPTGTT